MKWVKPTNLSRTNHHCDYTFSSIFIPCRLKLWMVQMRETNMIAAHVNYLLRFELIFCCGCISAGVQLLLCYIYVNYYVDADQLSEVMFPMNFATDLSIGLFLSTMMSIFYVAIQIKFSLLNDYFKWEYAHHPQNIFNQLNLLYQDISLAMFFRLIFIPSPKVIARPCASSAELQKLVNKSARIHDKLCQIYFKINRYATSSVI